MLILISVSKAFGLNAIEPGDEVVWNIAADHDPAGSVGSAPGEVKLASDLPNAGPAGKLQHAMKFGERGDVRNAFGRGAVAIHDPHHIKFGVRADGVMLKIMMPPRLGKPDGHIVRQRIEPGVLFCAHFVDQRTALLIRDFQRLREPDSHGSIHQRIAEKEKQNYRKQRHAHRAKHHLCLEARAENSGAMLGPQAHYAANQDEEENEENDEREYGKREKDRKFTVVPGMDGRVQRAECKNDCGQNGEAKAAKREPQITCPVPPRHHSTAKILLHCIRRLTLSGSAGVVFAACALLRRTLLNIRKKSPEGAFRAERVAPPAPVFASRNEQCMKFIVTRDIARKV